VTFARPDALCVAGYISSYGPPFLFVAPKIKANEMASTF
jgi:hypothetical protein